MIQPQNQTLYGTAISFSNIDLIYMIVWIEVSLCSLRVFGELGVI